MGTFPQLLGFHSDYEWANQLTFFEKERNQSHSSRIQLTATILQRRPQLQDAKARRRVRPTTMLFPRVCVRLVLQLVCYLPQTGTQINVASDRNRSTKYESPVFGINCFLAQFCKKKWQASSLKCFHIKPIKQEQATTGLRSIKDVGYCSAVGQAVLVAIWGSKLGRHFQ